MWVPWKSRKTKKLSPPVLGGEWRLADDDLGVVWNVHTNEVASLHVVSDMSLADKRLLDFLHACELGGTMPKLIAAITEDDGDTFLVGEWVGRTSLADRMVRPPPLNAFDLLMIAGRIGLALAKLHDAGLVHGDVRPEHIILRNRDTARAVLAGFRLDADGVHEQSPYTAPDVTGPQADIYALGSCLSQVEVPGPLPEPLRRLLDKMTHALPEKRFTDANAMLKEVAKGLRCVMRPGPEGSGATAEESAAASGFRKKRANTSIGSLSDSEGRAVAKRNSKLGVTKENPRASRPPSTVGTQNSPLSRKWTGPPILSPRVKLKFPADQRQPASRPKASKAAPAATPTGKPVVPVQSIERLQKAIEKRLRGASRVPKKQQQHQRASRPSADRELDHDEPTRDSEGRGAVKWFNDGKGFGFIDPIDGSKDVFVHIGGSKDLFATTEEPRMVSADNLEMVAPPVESTTEAERHLDVRLWTGHVFEAEDLEDRQSSDFRLVGRSEGLKHKGAYTLEVAIRAEALGIPTRDGVRRPVLQPVDPVPVRRIIARVRAIDQQALIFADKLMSIDWPKDSDSTAAYFRFTCREPNDPEQTFRIELRLYSDTLDLLELAELRGVSVGGEAAHYLYYPEGRRSEPLAAGHDLPGAVTLHVMGSDDGGGARGYTFEAIFLKRNGSTVALPLGRTISTESLNALLGSVRDCFTKLAVGIYADQLSVTATTYQTVLDEIGKQSRKAWQCLFGSSGPDTVQTSEVMAGLIGRLSPADGAAIKITFGDRAEDFVFPWAILRAPRDKDDPDAFWGLRFCIEQLRSGPRHPRLDQGPIRMVEVLDTGFANAVNHGAALQSLLAEAGTAPVPATSGSDLIAQLEADHPAHLYYFFCHGFAPGHGSAIAADAQQVLHDRIATLRGDSYERRLWENYLSLMGTPQDEAWIFFGTGKLTESELRDHSFFRDRRPMVFLNMCQSATLRAGISSGLTRVFLDHNASGVIGTECPVTATFADTFGREVLAGLLKGNPVGGVMLEARRKFHAERNPLGLIYTHYGATDVRLGPPPSPHQHTLRRPPQTLEEDHHAHRN